MTSTISRDHISVMKRVAATLYCRSVCSDFRRPVDSLYPKIIASYLTLIKSPMDLGTILYQVLREELSIGQFREQIQLVFNNAIIFNSGTPLMESISSHIDAFAGGLFEEALNLPYREFAPVKAPNANGSTGQSYITNFQLIRLSRRRFRMASVKNVIMNKAEMSSLLNSLNLILVRLPSTSTLLSPVIDRLKTILLDADGSNVFVSKISLSDVLSVALRTVSGPRSTSSVPDFKQPGVLNILGNRNIVALSSAQYSEDDPLSLIVDFEVFPEYISFVEALDESIGELLVCMQERYLRGCRYSSIWAVSNSLAWVQLVKQGVKDKSKVAWWVGLIIGGGKGTEIPMTVNDINTTRIPTSFGTQLLRTRNGSVQNKVTKGIACEEQPLQSQPNEILPYATLPPMYSKYIPPPQFMTSKYEKLNYASGNCSFAYGAEQRYLVEFFGTHDFGWVKGDCVLPFSSTPPGPRGCSQDAVEEAILAYKTMKNIIDEKWNTAPFSIQDAGDNDAMDDDEDIQLPLMVELEESIRHPPRPSVVYVGPPPVKEAQIKAKKTAAVTNPNDRETPVTGLDETACETTATQLTSFPVFLPLSDEENASKFSRAVARTRSVAVWMNAWKPVGIDNPQGASASKSKPPKGPKSSSSSPSVNQLHHEAFSAETEMMASDSGSRPVEIDSLFNIPSISKKRQSPALDSPSTQLSRGVDNMSPDEEIKPPSSKKMKSESAVVQGENGQSKKIGSGASFVCNISTPTARIYSGEGIVHSKIVDLKSPLFFYEDKRCEARKEILRAELRAIETALAKLLQASVDRDKQKSKLLPPRVSISAPSSLSGQSTSLSSIGYGVAPGLSTGSFSSVAMNYKVSQK